jgi:hypothetical protein
VAAQNLRLSDAATAVKAMLGSENCSDDLADDVVEVVRPHISMALQRQLKLAQARIEELEAQLAQS